MVICNNASCEINAVFNLTGQNKGVACKKNKKCEHPACTKIPAFNNVDEKNGKYCADHKTSLMVNVRSKKCEQPSCTKQPSFNNIGEISAKYCYDHKTALMVNVKNKTCKYPYCTKQPNFNV